MKSRFPHLILSSMMFMGITLAACDAPAEQGESDLPASTQSTETPAGVEAPMPVEPETATSGPVNEEAPHSDVPPPSPDVFRDAECNFEEWVNKPLDEEAINATGRPSRVMAPGSPMTMDHNPERINVEHENGTVTRVWCG